MVPLTQEMKLKTDSFIQQAKNVNKVGLSRANISLNILENNNSLLVCLNSILSPTQLISDYSTKG